MRSSVDFPAPLGPINRTNSPFGISSVTSQRAGRRSYCFVTWTSWIIAFSPAQIVPWNLKCILNMVDLHPCCRALKQHDVKPTRAVGPMVPGEELRRQAHQLSLLLPMYGMNRPAKIRRSACLDFHEHEHVAVLRHQIQLAKGRAQVLGDNPVALLEQIAFGRLLSFLPKESSRVKDCHAIVRRAPAGRAEAEHHGTGQSRQPRGHRSGDGSGTAHVSQAAANALPFRSLCERENCNADRLDDIRP